jgi:hypothetical protein
MFITYAVNIYVMSEEKSLIVKLAVPSLILVSFVSSGMLAYFGWIDTTWISAQMIGGDLIVKSLSYLTLSFAVILLIGTGARRAGYKQEELDKWGDDALSGKPPI